MYLKIVVCMLIFSPSSEGNLMQVSGRDICLTPNRLVNTVPNTTTGPLECTLAENRPRHSPEINAQGTCEPFADPDSVGLESCTTNDGEQTLQQSGPLSPAYSEFLSYDTLLQKD
jgi:hypothetical protein